MRFFAGIAVCSLLAAQPKSVTLDAVFAYRPDSLPATIWNPEGDRLLLVEGKALRLLDAATGQTTELATLADIEAKATKPKPGQRPFGWQNRRVAAARPEWSADSRRLLIAQGGDLFLLDVPSRQWTQLTATPEAEEDAHLSPDGRAVGFRRGPDLYVAEVAARRERRLTRDGSETLWNGKLDWVYPEELDLGRAWWWSSDSRSVAFLQFDVAGETVHPHVDGSAVQAVFEPQRFPKAGTPNASVRLGVVSARGGRTRWTELGPTTETLIARVQWLPGGGKLAVQRLSRVQDRLELLTAEAGTGRVERVLEEKDAAWVNLHDALSFFPDGRFLWASERSGYRHLYLYSAGGQLERQLTSGDWEVSGVEGMDGKYVYFTGTRESPLERHLYRVPLTGGEVERLTKERGTHTIAMAPRTAFFVDTHSNLQTPAARTLHRADGSRVAMLREANRKVLGEYAMLPVEPVRFRANGHEFYGQVIKPAGFTAGRKYPAIVMVYGGPHAQTVRDAWAGLNWEQALAARGFVVWRMDNRGAGGRGHGWETPLHRQFGKTELADQLAGVEYLVRQGFVDEKRIGIYGWSYGGYMTLYALANAPEAFAAGIAGAPVTDWRLYDTIYTERYMGLPEQNKEGYRESSAVTHAAKIRGQLLLVHNFQDDNVLFQNAQHMMEALQKANHQFEVMFYQQKSHGVVGPARRHLLETTTRFFERTLRLY
jgi:dipeptidyl-peptidase-4